MFIFGSLCPCCNQYASKQNKQIFLGACRRGVGHYKRINPKAHTKKGNTAQEICHCFNYSCSRTNGKRDPQSLTVDRFSSWVLTPTGFTHTLCNHSLQQDQQLSNPIQQHLAPDYKSLHIPVSSFSVIIITSSTSAPDVSVWWLLKFYTYCNFAGVMGNGRGREVTMSGWSSPWKWGQWSCKHSDMSPNLSGRISAAPTDYNQSWTDIRFWDIESGSRGEKLTQWHTIKIVSQQLFFDEFINPCPPMI